jgi:hypothetical protein
MRPILVLHQLEAEGQARAVPPADRNDAPSARREVSVTKK